MQRTKIGQREDMKKFFLSPALHEYNASPTAKSKKTARDMIYLRNQAKEIGCTMQELMG